MKSTCSGGRPAAFCAACATLAIVIVFIMESNAGSRTGTIHVRPLWIEEHRNLDDTMRARNDVSLDGGTRSSSAEVFTDGILHLQGTVSL